MTVARETQLVIETIADVAPSQLISQLTIETASTAAPTHIVSQLIIETLCDNGTPPSNNHRFFFGT